MKKINPYALLVLATLLWGGNFVIGRAITSSLPPFTLSFFRWCTAFLIFLPFAWSSLQKEWHLVKKRWPIVIMMALTGITGFNTLLYIALHYTTSINASLVNTSTPIVIYMLSFIVLKERLNKNQIIGTVLSLFGILFILSKGSLAILLNFSFNKGDLIVIAAVICWGIYSLLIKQYAGRLPGFSTFTVCMVLGIFLLLPFYIHESATTPVHWSVGSVLTILYTGIFASIVAFMSWNTAVARVGANKAGVFLNLIPVFAAFFAVLFIGEKLAWYQLAGGIIVILGVYMSTRLTKIEKQRIAIQREEA
ncbi:DMT family transporter [Fictibacillus barbaricus]|uniref:Drug/metabolite transporter (DMT)-like permease n=1 Tax=Fictibacillus barbaricus TaxID=182136 RepID=A0ABU1U1V4_9BACL|nr:DMT family transporter [Fictibacillus barbaricus]MDR7073463.1 drug/metabolite transporter (DMT)-like permease [Fictibacillus barbaricus]